MKYDEIQLVDCIVHIGFKIIALFIPLVWIFWFCLPKRSFTDLFAYIIAPVGGDQWVSFYSIMSESLFHPLRNIEWMIIKQMHLLTDSINSVSSAVPHKWQENRITIFSSLCLSAAGLDYYE